MFANQVLSGFVFQTGLSFSSYSKKSSGSSLSEEISETSESITSSPPSISSE